MAKKKRKSRIPARKKRKVPLRPAKKGAPQKIKAEILEGTRKTKIRVVGIGGGGANMVAEIARTVGRADYSVANTDAQSQKNLPKNVKGFMFGEEFTHGLGCGMDASLGESAAKAEKERIKKLFEGQDICILVASLGGGTGSGATPVFAEAAKEAKALTLGIFTMPFSFEGEKRREIARASLEKITPLLNAYVLIPNENIFRVIDADTPLRSAFSAVNKKLADTLEGFIDTLALPGLINIDFADVKTLLEGRGKLAYLNSVHMQGAPKAQLALKEVLRHPLLDYTIGGADRIIFNLTGDKAMKMQEVSEISRAIAGQSSRARIIFGISFQPEFKDRLRIALFAVGCKQGQGEKEKPKEVAQKKKGKIAKKGAPKKETKKKRQKQVSVQRESPRQGIKPRRNALDLKKAQDREMKDLEKQERQWDIPAFLRNTRREEPAS